MGLIQLIKYFPEKTKDIIYEIGIDRVNLYNLGLTDGDLVHITSEDEKLISYYPEEFSLDLGSSQSVFYIGKELIYMEEWVEEGILDDMMTNSYAYYNKVILMNRDGKIISEERGSLYRDPSVNYWIS